MPLNPQIILAGTAPTPLKSDISDAMNVRDMMDKSLYQRAKTKEVELANNATENPVPLTEAELQRKQRESDKIAAETNKIIGDTKTDDDIAIDRRTNLFKLAGQQATLFKDEADNMSQVASGMPDPVKDFKGAIDYYNQNIFPLAQNTAMYPKNLVPDLSQAGSEDEALGRLIKAREYITNTALTDADKQVQRAQEETARHNKQLEAIGWKNATRPTTGTNSIPPIAPIAGRTPEQQKFIERQSNMIISGQADPEMKDLAGRSALVNLKPDIEDYLAQNYPEFNMANAAGDRKYWNNDKTRRQIQVMSVVSEQLPKLMEASQKLKSMGIQSLTEATVKALAGAGNVDAANYLSSILVSVEDVAKAIGGGSAITDDQLELAKRMFPIGGTPEQLAAYANQINNGVNSRKATVYQQGGVYGKIAAKNDPWLDPQLKEKILNGNFSESAPPAKDDFDAMWGK